METIRVQINNSNAYHLLEDLEKLDIIKLLRDDKQPANKKKLSAKYAGIIPSDLTEELQKYIAQSREQWNTHVS